MSAEKYARFMVQADAAASMSKYPGTRVGAFILGDDYEPLSSGWNGAPRGCKADEDGRLGDRQSRLLWAVHAEANAIYNAARSGHSLKGSTIVVTHPPCLQCAKAIIQAGIVRVIARKPALEFQRKWFEDFVATRSLFKECHIEYIWS